MTKNMNFCLRLTVLATFCFTVIGFPSLSFAAESSNTVGDSIVSARASLPSILVFVNALCVFVALCLVGKGLHVLGKWHDKQSGERAPVMHAGCLILGGCLLCAIPQTISVSSFSLMGQQRYASGIGVNAGSVSTCVAGSAGSGAGASAIDNTSPAECVMQNIGVNVVPVALNMIYALGMLIGFIIIARALAAFAIQYGTPQSRQTIGGLCAKIVIGSIACNLPAAMFIMQSTLGVGSGTMTMTGSVISGSSLPSIMTYTPSTDITILQDAGKTISWCFVFLSLVGVLAYCKGLAQLYAISVNGSAGGRASLASAMTFMIAGIAVANMKWTACLFMKTFSNDDMGLCNN